MKVFLINKGIKKSKKKMTEEKNEKWFIAFQIAKSINEEIKLNKKEFIYIAIKYRVDDYMLKWGR